MLLSELFSDTIDQDMLNEINWKGALAAGAVAASAAFPVNLDQPISPQWHPRQNTIVKEIERIAGWVSSVYRIDPSEAMEIVQLAKKYEQPDFPKAKDIIAVIGVESSFDADARSKLKKDPAIGLMQVRPKTNSLDANEITTSIEAQIREGVKILLRNYKRLGDKEAALHAYNLGVTAYLRGDRNINYVQKFKKLRGKLG